MSRRNESSDSVTPSFAADNASILVARKEPGGGVELVEIVGRRALERRHHEPEAQRGHEEHEWEVEGAASHLAYSEQDAPARIGAHWRTA
jgi:hypothetical protein